MCIQGHYQESENTAEQAGEKLESHIPTAHLVPRAEGTLKTPQQGMGTHPYLSSPEAEGGGSLSSSLGLDSETLLQKT